MIRMINAFDHANIGDCRASVLLKTWIEVWSGMKVEFYGYKLPFDESDITKFNSGSAVIVGPGGTFFGGKYTLFSMKTPELYDKIKVPVISMSAGINLWDSPTQEWLASTTRTFRRFDLLGLRTYHGVELANSMGFDKACHSPDPMLFIGDPRYSPIVRNKVVTAWYGVNPEKYVNYLKERGFDVVTVSHHGKDMLRLSEYSGCDFVLGDRFHGCVLAAAFGKPFITFSRDSKLIGITKDFNMPFILDEGQPFIDVLNSFLDCRDSTREKIAVSIDMAKNEFVNFLDKAVNIINV